AVVDANRADAAAAGLVLRPLLFKEDAQVVADSPARSAEPSSPPETEPRTPTTYTPANTLFLQIKGKREGVLSVHRVLDTDVEGYQLVFRITETWPLLSRKQQFTNWHTKRDSMMPKLERKWSVDCDLHIIRKLGYKGHQVAADAVQRPRLSFDGVASALQLKGCKKTLKDGCLAGFDLLITNCCKPDESILLLPDEPDCAKEACMLRCLAFDLDLETWGRCLQFLDIKSRWEKCSMISGAQQRLQAGVPLSAASWFLMRLPFDEVLCEAGGRAVSKLPDFSEDCFTRSANLQRAKVKHAMAMERFLARSSGFANKSDATLDELGLGWLAPSHSHRLASDLAFRYLRLAGTSITQELNQQTFRSLSFLCDASPKAFKELWCPIVGVNNLAVPWVVQRLSDLLPSTAETSEKLQAAQEVADGLAGKMVDDSRARAKPKSLSRVQQARLATREQVQAVLHSLELLELELKPGKVGYPSADPKEGFQRCYHDGKPFLYDVNKGEGLWLEVEDDDRVRLILNPDEGSPLFAGFQFLANVKLPVAFRRDE
ncbi:hemA, partial [Symbiodinium sp. KB8]